MNISSAEAKLELAILNSTAQELDYVDVVTRLTNSGLQQEIITRLQELWTSTKIVSGKVVYVGRIIVLEIMRFIEKNQNLAIGIAVGAAVGAIVGLVPFLGPLLAPLTTAIGIIIGGVAGLRLDRNQESGEGVISTFQEVIILARKFFELLAEIFFILKNEYNSDVRS